MRQIYLDNNATTPVAASVREAMTPFLSEFYGNPSSAHAHGRICREAIEDARGHVAALIGADREELVFTGGGTESNNLALLGVMLQEQSPRDGHLIITAVEHPAISEPARYLEEMGFELTVVACDRRGLVDPADIKKALRRNTQLVSVMHANNEIGTLQPLAEIGAICRENEVLFHTDAAQSVGKIRANVEELHVDLLSIAGHKLYAPKGVGALFVRQSVDLQPVIHGAAHERGLRPGTENVPHIVGLGAAALLSINEDEADKHLAVLRDQLLALLRNGIEDGLTCNGAGAPCLPNTLSVNFPHVAGSELLARVPEICASTGSACHSTGTTVSTTLRAIQLDPEIARGTVRLSVGRYTTQDDVVKAANLLIGAWEALV